MSQIIWESDGGPFLVRELKGLLYLIQSVRITEDAKKWIEYLYYPTQPLIIGVDVEEKLLEGLTLNAINSQGINVQAQRIEECRKLARIFGYEYAAIREEDRLLSGIYKPQLPGGLESTTATPRLFRKTGK
ncbi:hypothetical protein HYV80_07045 [Candidatus Woesearchaeota archaeon]|nr:hypothetical protein [Candidatus Woesearchaeota archaeon]